MRLYIFWSRESKIDEIDFIFEDSVNIIFGGHINIYSFFLNRYQRYVQNIRKKNRSGR